MTKKFTVLIEQDEEGIYVGKVPELKGCISQGDTIDELVNNIKEAIELCLEVNKEKDVSFDNLKYLAKEVANNTWSPYSHFPVGAVVVGIDQKNSSIEGISELLSICTNLYIYHNELLTQTFHPKIYIFEKENTKSTVFSFFINSRVFSQ